MQISGETLKIIQQFAVAPLDRLEKGELAVDVAAWLYRTRLPGKGEEISAMVAQCLEDIVTNYETECRAALEDEAAWVEDQLARLCEGRTLRERCESLYQVLRGLILINGGDPFPQPAGCSEALEASLREEIVRELENCRLDATMMDAMGEALETLEDLESQEQIGPEMARAARSVHDRRVVLAMTAYVSAKTGLLGDDFTENMSFTDIALTVCAASDAARVAAKVSAGELSKERGARILRTIAKVLALVLGVSIVLLGSAALEVKLGLIMLPVLVLAACVALAFLLFETPSAESIEAGGGLRRQVGDALETLRDPVETEDAPAEERRRSENITPIGTVSVPEAPLEN